MNIPSTSSLRAYLISHLSDDTVALMSAKNRAAQIILFLALCLNVFAEAKPDIRDVIFDPEKFVSALGKNVLIVDLRKDHSPKQFDECVAILRKIVKDSKRDPKPNLFVFPENGTPPKLIGTPPIPVYPKELKERGIGGSEKYILMLNPEGKVAALYCYEKDQYDLAVNGALSIARAKFSPAKIESQAIPVVVFFALNFEVR